MPSPMLTYSNCSILPLQWFFHAIMTSFLILPMVFYKNSWNKGNTTCTPNPVSFYFSFTKEKGISDSLVVVLELFTGFWQMGCGLKRCKPLSGIAYKSNLSGLLLFSSLSPGFWKHWRSFPSRIGHFMSKK